jgi:nitroreductase
MAARAAALFAEMDRRRSVRHFSDRPVPEGVIEHCVRTAATAPSGANLQPFHFVVIRDPEVKRNIRIAAEAEEREFYEHRAPAEWLEALAPLGTDPSKPFLQVAPVLVAVFVKRYCPLPDGRQVSYPYAIHSAGLATGLLIAAVHHAGLACLTHTPSHMGFLGRILQRPSNERAFLLLVAGYPADDAVVPNIKRKPISELASFV